MGFDKIFGRIIVVRDSNREEFLMDKYTKAVSQKINNYHLKYIINREPLPETLDGMKQEIVDSWRRSLSLNLNHDEIRNSDIPEKEFKKILAKNKDYIDAATPYLTLLFNSMEKTNSLIQLCDSNCNILKTFYENDDSIGPLMENLSRNKEGYMVSEEAIGTNSTALSMRLNRPIRVHSCEHFRVTNHMFACSSSPVHDRNGNIIGCITIMTPAKNYQPHTLSAAIAASDMIEKELETKEYYSNLQNLNLLLQSSIDSFSYGMMILDTNYTILHHNKVSLDILKLEDSDINDTETSFFSIFDKNNLSDLEKNLQSGVTEEEFKILNRHLKPVSLSLSVSHIKNKSKNIEFYIVFFSSMASKVASAMKLTGATAEYTLDDIVGNSSSINYVKNQAENAAKSNSNVLLSGESGTGKELIAQSIHNASSRASGPFIAINCGALPKSLVESELFGYEKGSYTGANRNGNPGKFELANHGTIFLDEIGEIPLEIQTTLLRVLQTKEVTRIGGNNAQKVDIKIIAATNVDLLEAIRQNKFRADLYYRLNVINISLPALRDRKEDIPLLSEYFLAYYSRAMQKEIYTINSEVMNLFMQYSWPGNIRELENTIERAVNLSNTTSINIEDLPSNLLIPGIQGNNMYMQPVDPRFNMHYNPYQGGYPQYPVFQQPGYYNTPYMPPNLNLPPQGFGSNHHAEYNEIVSSLEVFNGNVKEAAASLKIPVSTLYSKLKKYGINPKSFKE